MGRGYVASHVANVLDRLDGVRATGHGWVARCPAHADHEPSLSIGVSEKSGDVLLNCFAGCATDAIVTAIGLEVKDLFRLPLNGRGLAPVVALHPAVSPVPLNGHGTSADNGAPAGATKTMAAVAKATLVKRKRPDEHDELVAVYAYRHVGTGDVVAEKGRFEDRRNRSDKTFLWRRVGEEQWSGLKGLDLTDIALWGSDPATMPDGQSIAFVEGEKAAQACLDHGLPAVTFAGGASSKRFGDSLQALSGKVVLIWPDADKPGRDYAKVIEKELSGIAKRALILRPPAVNGRSLPETGDAADWFALGGTVDDLLRVVPSDDVQVDTLAHDALRLTVWGKGENLTFDLSELEWIGRDLNCEVEIRVGRSYPFTERINLSSWSAKDALRRALDAEYKNYTGDWAGVLNRVFGAARTAYVERSRVQLYRHNPTPVDPEYILEDVIPAGVPSVLFGDGASTKTFGAYALALCVAAGRPFLGLATRRRKVLVIDYETTYQDYQNRLSRLAQGLELGDLLDGSARESRREGDNLLASWLGYFPAHGVPFAELHRFVRREIERHGFEFIVIDSGGPACGGKPEDAENAIRYFSGLRRIGDGITTLTLCHVAKHGEHRQDRPFGSIFWETQPRLTINAVKTGVGTSSVFEIGWFPRKANGPLPAPLGMRIDFGAARNGPIHLRRINVSETPELDSRRPLKDRVWDVLASTPRSIKEIAEQLAEDPERIGACLRGDKRRFVNIYEGGSGGRGHTALWARAAIERT